LIFVVGVVVSISTTAVVFGGAVLATIVAVASVLISILNGLLTPASAKGSNGDTWLPATLKRCLNVSSFLKTATVAVWLSILGLSLYGGIRVYNAAQLVSIDGIVETAAGEPADNAIVTLLSSAGQRSTVCAGGRFSFGRVDTRDTRSTALEIEAQWKGSTARKEIDLAELRHHTLIIKIPVGNPPFRVSYYVLGGQAIDFLTRGEMDEQWEKTLAGQPFIVPNSVFQELSSIVRRFSFTFRASYIYLPGRALQEQEKAAQRNYGRPVFVGSGWPRTFLLRDPRETEVRSLSDSAKSWQVGVNRYDQGAGLVGSLVFWKFAGPDEVSTFGQNERDPSYGGGAARDFYLYITRASMPPDFCVLVTEYQQCGGGMFTGLETRAMRLRVAVLENITAHPISVGAFRVKEALTDRLRSREENVRTRDRGTYERKLWFPQQSLRPGEKIVIPIEMSLAFEKEKNWLLYNLEADAALRNAKAKEVADATVLRFPMGRYSIDMDTAPVAAMLSRPMAEIGLNREYIYGPSVSIDTVDVDDVSYAFRQFDPQLVVFRSGSETGSCPYVYTFSSASHSWLNEGPVLYGKNSRQKEGVDEKELRMFDGRILIREEEPELTFINSLYVKAVTKDGAAIVLRPKNDPFTGSDGYLKLKQGEQLEVDFDFPPKVAAADKFILITQGFYVTN
jgi:hypothetical protein